MYESSYITADIPDELSISYTNLYYLYGQFVYLSLTPVDLPMVNIWNHMAGLKPIVKVFESQEALTMFADRISRDIMEVDLAVYAPVTWSENIGHAIYDSFYPMNLALIKFSRHLEDFTHVVSYWDSSYSSMSYSMIEDFSHNKIIELSKLGGKNIHFKTLISGSGRVGNRVMREDYTLYGAKYDGMKLFKKRLLETYNIEVNKPVSRFKPKMIIIDNKRYSKEEREELFKVVNHFKGKGYDIEYIFWERLRPLSKQLEFLSNVDIQITGPGTGMCYMPFMKKGAVNVNLGCIKHVLNQPENTAFPAYMSQAFCAGAHKISTVYHDRLLCEDLNAEAVIRTVNIAIYMIREGIISTDNHYTDAKVLIEYCKRVTPEAARALCDHLTGTGHFVEYFTAEDSEAIPPHLVDVKLLRQIKKELNFNIRDERKKDS